MGQGRFTLSLLVVAGFCFAATAVALPASAGPPTVGDSDSGSWLRLPTLSEPSFLKATRVGMSRAWNGVERTTRSAWQATIYVLRPYDPPQQEKRSSQRSSPEQGGFWANLFGGGAAPKEATVNDFLRQPMPQ